MKTYFPGDVIQLFSKVKCCICQQPIDTSGWYASYNDNQKAHSECFQKAREVNHDTRLINYTESHPIHI